MDLHPAAAVTRLRSVPAASAPGIWARVLGPAGIRDTGPGVGREPAAVGLRRAAAANKARSDAREGAPWQATDHACNALCAAPDSAARARSSTPPPLEAPALASPIVHTA